MRSRVVFAFAVAACGRLHFDPTSELDARGPGDASAAGCVAVGASDDFSDGVACTPWGTPITARTTISEANGELVITPQPDMTAATGSCQRSGMPVPDTGLFVEITAVLPFGSTGISVDDGLMPTGMFVNNTKLSVDADSSTAGMGPYDPVAMRWWRIRRGPGVILYETSPDASTWTIFAQAAIQIAATATVQLFAAQQTAVAAPGSARFGAVNVCP